MRRLGVMLCGLALAGTIAQAQTVVIGVKPASLAPVIVFPASAVNGAGTLNMSCFTFPSGTTLCENASGKLNTTGTTPMIQLGGTTSSFPAWKQIGNVMTARLADDSAYATISVNNVTFNGGLFPGGNALLVNAVAPTISSGFGTSPSIANNNGQAAFTINVGTGGAASSGVVGLPTATTGWNCWVNDLTAAAAHVAYNTRQTASTTTTATLENQTTSTGAAVAWAASDILRVSCFAY